MTAANAGSKLLKSRTRVQGGSLVTTLPAEVVRRMSIGPDDDLYWRETAPGVYTVTVLDPGQATALEAHERILEKYKDVFAALAK